MENNVFSFEGKKKSIETLEVSNPGVKEAAHAISVETEDESGDLIGEISLGVPGEDEELENQEWLERKAV